MIAQIAKIRRTPKPSSFKPGTTWNLVEVKLVGQGEVIYELQGFGKQSDNLKEGDTIKGYMSQKTWGRNNTVTNVFNKITAEYVYDLLLKMDPTLEEAAIAEVSNGFGAPAIDISIPEVGNGEIPW